LLTSALRAKYSVSDLQVHWFTFSQVCSKISGHLQKIQDME